MTGAGGTTPQSLLEPNDHAVKSGPRYTHGPGLKVCPKASNAADLVRTGVRLSGPQSYRSVLGTHLREPFLVTLRNVCLSAGSGPNGWSERPRPSSIRLAIASGGSPSFRRIAPERSHEKPVRMKRDRAFERAGFDLQLRIVLEDFS